MARATKGEWGKEGREVREERMRRRGEKSEWKFIGHIKGLISVLKR